MVTSINGRHGDGNSTRKSGIKRKKSEGGSSTEKHGKMMIDSNPRHDKKHGWEEEREKIWINILSRLPLKTLLVCQSVCKSWKRIVRRIKKKLKFLPLDGLFVRSSSYGETTKNHLHLNYVSLSMKKTIEMQINNPSSLVVGNKTSLLANISFDFGGLHVENPSDANNIFFAIYRGLILAIDADGSYKVHNPATRKVFVLPKSPVCKAYSDRGREELLERAGFIIKLWCPFSSDSGYLVARLCRVSKKVEVCRSYRRHKWKVSRFSLDDELMNACWCWESYVVIRVARTLCFLTDTDRGVAIEFCADVQVHGFSLPSLVQKGYNYTRLGGSRKCLHLASYCKNDNNTGGLWIWKHVDAGHTVTEDAWIPLVEISRERMRQLSFTCMPSELVSKLFKEDDDDFEIIPMCFHSEITVVYLRVKSSIFAYDIDNDTLEAIGEINHQVFGASATASPYLPCLSSLEPSMRVPYTLPI